MVSMTSQQLDINTLVTPLISLMVVVMMMKMMMQTMSGSTQLEERGMVLEPEWWAGYQFRDVPSILNNPHFESVWGQAPPDKQQFVLMAVGTFREQNVRRKAMKYEYFNRQMEQYGVYTGVTTQQFLTGNMKYFQIIAAGIMEVFTPTGLYTERVGVYEVIA